MPAISPTPFENQLLDELQQAVVGSCARQSALRDQYWQDLTKEERTPLAKAVGKRRREFAAGRRAAKQCAKRLGMPIEHLLIGTQREPCWPPSIKGTITHDATSAFAWLVSSDHIRGLGLDVEKTSRLKRDTWRLLFTQPELTLLQTSADPELALTFFSAKESVYKCLFPTVKRFVGYKEVCLQPSGTNQFRCVMNDSLAEESGVDELSVYCLRSPSRLATWTWL
ncbi:MAG: 4'-phosphopantetheinyl transferase [Lysobacterales bacterium]